MSEDKSAWIPCEWFPGAWMPAKTDASHESSFVELCRQLRLLGATEVSGHGYSARFEGRVVVQQAPQNTRPKTPDELREEAYRRELGEL